MNPDMYLMEAYQAGARSERDKRERQREASRAAQPKRKNHRKKK